MLQNISEKTAGVAAQASGHVMMDNLVQSLPAAVYTCDADGVITFYNEAAVSLWGRRPEIGKERWCGAWKLYNSKGTPLPHEKCPMAVALKEERTVEAEEIIVERPDGSRLYVQPHPQPFYGSSGMVIGAFNMLTDVTRQKKDLQMLRESEERAIELRSKNEELERSNEELASFSYIASHDLQEPLRKIITFSDKLRLELGNDIPQQGRECLDRIISSSVRMKQLIEDVLNFSRVSSGGEKFANTDLNETLRNVLTDFDQRILEKKAEITVDQLPILPAVPVQMRQLFYNLVSNALKFSAADKTPHIRISSRLLSKEEVKENARIKRKRNNYCEITVSDNGIGFKQEYAEKIFTIFQRLNGRSEYSGTGIGLALCRKIADNHRGAIYAESEAGSGSAFHVLLPMNLV